MKDLKRKLAVLLTLCLVLTGAAVLTNIIFSVSIYNIH